MKTRIVILILGLATAILATTYHTLPFNGQNAFAPDEDFITSTDTVLAYCTWDDQYLYLGLSSPFLATPNDTARGRYDSFWYIDTDPHPDNPKSGLGTDQTGSYFIQINTSQPWWFDEQSWELPFFADYRIIPRYYKKDSVYASFYYYDSDSARWFFRGDIDTSLANLNYIDGYYELRLPLDSLNFPTDINILGYSVDGQWESDIYWDDEYGFTRDVGGTFASWPWSSLVGGDGDYHTKGKFNHWFHFHLQPGISPDQENDPPVASPITGQTINEGESFAVIDLNSYVFDDLTPDTLLIWTTETIDLIVTIQDSNQAQVSTPNPNWNGTETITFIVTDEGGKSDTTTGTFTMLGDNQIPVAVNDSSNTIEEQSVSINLTANDSDADNDSLHIDRILTTNNGTVVIDNDSMVTYTPNVDFHGTDSFEYVVTDGNGGRDTATVFVTVDNRNDPPEIVNLPDVINMTTNDSTKLYMMDYAYDVDTPDSLLTWSFSVNDPAISYAYDQTTDTLTIYSHEINGDFYLFTTLTDDSGASDQDTITIRVSGTSALDLRSTAIPDQFTVLQNFPNPFNPSTHLAFGLTKSSDVQIEIFNILGQRVFSKRLSGLSAGFHTVKVDAARWPAGIYLYRISAENTMVIKKMVLVR
ncbi:Ig-like domain-containing protein [Caldithrix abyssi]|uniref:Por secretion system C-terminal sorting domain-containing protein n=1 Tax=Caldithrix abyssi DSM 13497 TaxID=880073 RepID=H1XP57_CALAY|nr:tandem-95 repeat protein [Caldithrix abyssi]APF18140.1 Por secretion system C-terminal sorting domain-containing protein [Caldithrix abyssi DSM 13497]EHO42172.1 hypothetical protein Calab_2562 [Caldithrix abyssi DSM 13497]